MAVHLKVLLVGEFSADSERLRRQLRGGSFDPDLVSVGGRDEFLAALQASPDLVIADYGLPAFGALAAIEVLKGRQNPPPLIVVSDAIGEERAAEAVRLGAADYLRRDNLGRLESAVTNVLEVSRLRSARLETDPRLEAVMVDAPLVVLVLDATGRIQFGLGGGLVEAGLDPSELANSPTFESLLWDGGSDASPIIARARAGSAQTFCTRYRGSEREHEVKLNPVLDEDGHLRRIIAVSVDITDRLLDEAKDRESRAKSDAMRLLSHDVRTPLNAILGFTELLLTSRDGAFSDQQRRFLSNIQAAGRHLLEVVNDSVDLARIAAGGTELEMADVSLDLVVDQALGQVRPLAEAREQTLVTAVQPDIWAFADHRRLLQVMLNLLTNAIKHTPPGGTIQIRVLPDPADPGRWVRIEVEDSGGGIPEDQQERIFEQYTRFEQQAGPAPEASGLGLALTRELMGLMQGSVGLRSEMGKGSVFWLRARSNAPCGPV
ncbi:MAG: ATP-binding protein [Candidatus Dormibacteraceae bacterium]